MGLSTVFAYLPFLAEKISSGFRIIIITVVVAAAAALLAPRPDDEDSMQEMETAGGEEI
jgi:hypothetical protein